MPGKADDYAKFLTSIAVSFPSQKRFALLTDYKDNYLVDLAHQSQSILVSDDNTFKTAQDNEATARKGDQQERVLQSDWVVSGLANSTFVQPDLSGIGASVYWIRDSIAQ